MTACAVSHGQDEAIIEENGHLPGMPSVTTVAEEGVSIGEVQRVLLKNVEELTLRLIEKDKRVKELEERNSSLEDRLERIERMLMEERE